MRGLLSLGSVEVGCIETAVSRTAVGCALCFSSAVI